MEKGIERNKIEEEKEELLKWKKKIKKYLGINTYKQEEFFLISKYWFENYKNNFLHLKLNRRNSSVLFDEILDNNNELFTTFTENKIDISNLPKIFVLNKTIWFNIQNENQELNSIAAIGYYSNKLLTLKVLNLVYCFLFLDHYMQIRQGYLEIIKKKNEDNIIKEFKQKGFFDFIKKDKKEEEYNDNIFQINTDNYKMIVFKSFFKEENKKKIIEKDDYEKQIIQRKRAKTLRQSINIKDKNIDESKYFFGNKVFTIKKSNKIDEKEKMGKIKQLFKNFYSLFIVKKEKEKNKIKKEIIKEEEIKKNNSIKKKDKKEKNKKKNSEKIFSFKKQIKDIEDKYIINNNIKVDTNNQNIQINNDIKNEELKIEKLYDNNSSYSLLYKIILIGDTYCGKTWIIESFISFPSESFGTTGVDTNSCFLKINDKIIKLLITDCPGIEKYFTICMANTKGKDLIMFVYSIDNKDSFISIKNRIKKIKYNNKDNPLYILIGSKTDLENNRQISYEQGQELAILENINFFIEVSAKMSFNIGELFFEAIRLLYKKKK